MDPVRDSDERARETARAMLAAMRHATLAVNDPQTGHPHMARIACQVDRDGVPVALIAGISAHSRALQADPRAALFVETAQEKGDPMTWARISIRVTAALLPEDEELKARWIARDAKARIYAALPDFRFWRLAPAAGFMNAGFGAAFRLTPEDLKPAA
ncbi:pyridoxamine 5'-phosphate oxidase family protein [Paracoccus siganidrum]|uniref:Pyridoxamine 5-phosphate oxidase n=1 Tax=Paracoccus siganidrum TaxID=1276757 RepID=A0A419A9C0_9RHOB|nr:pyridoxamine 5'-phosphate oxidase family protein [Paracoccus siganidrum]RJL18615.1 pyridoxamine 5-phosphate oxidase [Paracoccus siganidrum]RMC36879.1 pyridoxamine 5-phosphate oxidase [Paracoccus siganidrum]